MITCLGPLYISTLIWKSIISKVNAVCNCQQFCFNCSPTEFTSAMYTLTPYIARQRWNQYDCSVWCMLFSLVYNGRFSIIFYSISVFTNIKLFIVGKQMSDYNSECIARRCRRLALHIEPALLTLQLASVTWTTNWQADPHTHSPCRSSTC